MQHRADTSDSPRSGDLQQAMQALRQGRPETARKVLLQILALDPESAQANFMLGIASQMTGAFGDAVAAFRKACQLVPEDAAACMGLGMALHDHGDQQEAIAAMQRACELARNVPGYWFNLGKALLASQPNPAEAQAAFDRALALEPGHLPARMGLADVHILVGEIDRAVARYREVLRREPDHAKAWLGLADIKTEPMSRRDLSALERAWRVAPPGSAEYIALGFALSKAQEDQGDYEAAFATLRKCNAAKRASITWDARAEHAYHERIESVFHVLPGTSAEPGLGAEVLFIISLPRSGSTLVEQILASHPEVEGAGEITDLQRVIDDESRRRGETFPAWVPHATAADWTRLGRAYLDGTRRHRELGRVFTDKNLLNWKLAGAAHAMLPGARFVHVQRDATETCLACYRQLFRNGNPFSYDLGEMTGYWRDSARLCHHWKTLFPDSWHDLVYERLLDHPEQEIHQLLEFCGLPDAPACLQFHDTQRVVRTASAAQVRQPLRRDTARAALYGHALDPLRDLLEHARS